MRTFWSPAILLLTVGASASFAQVAITSTEGNVEVDGRSPPQLDRALPVNSLVRTANGRAQIRFGSGDTLFLGENSSIRVTHNAATVSDEPEILTGSAVVITSGVGPAIPCVKSVQLSDAGIFRFDVHRVGGENFCRLKVYKGAATAQMLSFTWVLTTGKTIDLNRTCGDMTPRDEFDVESMDALDRWTRQRAKP
jgi:hypothetical protein